MVRLADLSEVMRAAVSRAVAVPMAPPPWTPPRPAPERTVALVSSAGLGLVAEPPFRGGDAGYREIPHATPDGDIVMSHISVNYDRTGYQLDPETVFPRRRLAELAAAGVIGTAAETHYSFMGATEPEAMEDDARRLAGVMRERGVNTAALLPV